MFLVRFHWSFFYWFVFVHRFAPAWQRAEDISIADLASHRYGAYDCRLMFRFMMNDQYGVFNYFAESLGFSRISWLSDPQLALPALILTDVWQWTPFMMIILLAGLKGIPSDPYEAAKIDGATASQTFFYVTIPLLSKIIYIALLLRTIDAFRIYDTIYMMTKGGPINVTSTLSWIVYDKGFKFLDFGYGAALSVVMLILVVTLLMLFLRKVDLFNVEASHERIQK